jgi:hypothetical protein
MITTRIALSLFDLKQDIGETKNVADEHPEIVRHLLALAENVRDDLGDSLQKREGKNVRPPGQLTEGPTVLAQGKGGVVQLHARNAATHGTKIRYEPQAFKNTIGFWIEPEDWVSWEFSIEKPGIFGVEILQGCGKDSGGSEVTFSIGDQHLSVTVQDTGAFQNFITRDIGRFNLAQAGRYTLAVRAKSKPRPAVMDLRQVLLRPITP